MYSRLLALIARAPNIGFFCFPCVVGVAIVIPFVAIGGLLWVTFYGFFFGGIKASYFASKSLRLVPWAIYDVIYDAAEGMHKMCFDDHTCLCQYRKPDTRDRRPEAQAVRVVGVSLTCHRRVVGVSLTCHRCVVGVSLTCR